MGETLANRGQRRQRRRESSRKWLGGPRASGLRPKERGLVIRRKPEPAEIPELRRGTRVDRKPPDRRCPRHFGHR
eukprot:11155375-Lingulodinium_polyedra.AAC.1